jgi:transcriptional regulator with XRE-family HTH domain
VAEAGSGAVPRATQLSVQPGPGAICKAKDVGADVGNDANHDHVPVHGPHYPGRDQEGGQMSREPEAIVEQRRQLGAALATFRQAGALTQAQVGTETDYDRTSINKIERGHQLPDRPFWQAVDGLLRAEGALVKHYEELVASKREYAERQRRSSQARHQADAQHLRRAGQPTVQTSLHAASNDFAASTSPLSLPVSSYADTAYLEAAQQHIWHVVELDNRFGGSDLARLAVRFFRSVHQQLGTGAYEPAIERDSQATAGELAEVAGWLLYDADRQDDVRRMNQEALYFSRLAGDRRMELLTLQNASMHAGHLERPREALHLARSVLESRDRLSPRVKALFLVRKGRALAQGGDEHALRLFDEVRSHYEDGVRESDPKWAWWVDERELAWHEGMALIDLGRPGEAVDKFQQSVWVMSAHQMRGRYLHLGYLLGAQVKVGAWSDAETTMRQILTMVSDVSSTRTVVLLTAILPKLLHERVPGSTRDTAEQLALLLSQAST